jgi:hypothetical protein
MNTYQKHIPIDILNPLHEHDANGLKSSLEALPSKIKGNTLNSSLQNFIGVMAG